MKSPKIKVVSDYILIRPDKPKGGDFSVGDTYIDESGTIEDIGAEVGDHVAKLKGKRVIFNAWACDQKTLHGQRYYFASASANAIVATL